MDVKRCYLSGPQKYIVLLLLTIAIYCMLKYHLIYKEAYYYIILKERMNARIQEIEKSRGSYIKNLMSNYNHNKNQSHQVEFSHASSFLLLNSMHFVTTAREFKIVPIRRLNSLDGEYLLTKTLSHLFCKTAIFFCEYHH